MVCDVLYDNLPCFIAWNNRNGVTKYTFQRRRCCAFSAQFAINFGIKKRQSWYKKNVSTPSVLRFLSVIHHESPHYNHVFSKKAQHLRRWISLWTLTRGRLVPHQPRAIKRTTRTELRDENIHGNRCIHWNISMTPTALRGESIHHSGYIHWNLGVFCNLFIRMLVSIIL